MMMMSCNRSKVEAWTIQVYKLWRTYSGSKRILRPRDEHRATTRFQLQGARWHRTRSIRIRIRWLKPWLAVRSSRRDLCRQRETRKSLPELAKERWNDEGVKMVQNLSLRGVTHPIEVIYWSSEKVDLRGVTVSWDKRKSLYQRVPKTTHLSSGSARSAIISYKKDLQTLSDKPLPLCSNYKNLKSWSRPSRSIISKRSNPWLSLSSRINPKLLPPIKLNTSHPSSNVRKNTKTNSHPHQTCPTSPSFKALSSSNPERNLTR